MPTKLPEKPKIALLSLLYNSERFVDRYLAALARIALPPSQLEIYLLDNCSRDDSFGKVERYLARHREFPFRVHLTRHPTNTGFSGGNNLLFSRVLAERSADAILLLNIDTEIAPDCISNLIARMQTDPFIGMTEARQQPREHPKWYDPATFETGWCSGGGVLIRAEALREVGLFDHRFFLYCEDVDLSWRMWLHGWRCTIEPRATYFHFTEDLDKEKDRSIQTFYSLRNSYFMHWKYDTWQGIVRHERAMKQALATRQDPKEREVFQRAIRASRKFILSMIFERIKLSRLRRSPWIVFNNFDYERRRKFEDLPDGTRRIYDEAV